MARTELVPTGRPEPMPPGGTWPPEDPPRTPARVRGEPPTVPLELPSRAEEGVEPAWPGGARWGGGPPRMVGPESHRPGASGSGPSGSGPSGPGLSGSDARETGRVRPAVPPTGRVAGAVRALAPAALRHARLDPGRPGATALALVAALAAVLAAVGVWTARPQAEPVAALPSVVVSTDAADPAAEPVQAAPAAATAPTTASSLLVVSVSGRVARPGLVEVPDGSRVAAVLDAAGGALPGTDLSTLNLARRVTDGEQIAVGVPPATDAAPAPGAGAGTAGGEAAAGGPVDLNTATAEQLDALPGVGPVTAQRILEWRERNGRFSRIEQLREIEGIGERRFAQLRELVVVA